MWLLVLAGCSVGCLQAHGVEEVSCPALDHFEVPWNSREQSTDMHGRYSLDYSSW